MARKLLLNGAVIFVTDTQTQVLLGMMICFGAVCAQQVSVAGVRCGGV